MPVPPSKRQAFFYQKCGMAQLGCGMDQLGCGMAQLVVGFGSMSARCKAGPRSNPDSALGRCLPLSCSAMREWRGASANVHGSKNVRMYCLYERKANK